MYSNVYIHMERNVACMYVCGCSNVCIDVSDFSIHMTIYTHYYPRIEIACVHPCSLIHTRVHTYTTTCMHAHSLSTCAHACSLLHAQVHTYTTTANPLGVTFSKAQSSKLERLFCHVLVKRDVRALSFEL